MEEPEIKMKYLVHMKDKRKVSKVLASCNITICFALVVDLSPMNFVVQCTDFLLSFGTMCNSYYRGVEVTNFNFHLYELGSLILQVPTTQV